jgi:PAS domain S-box-containing protein
LQQDGAKILIVEDEAIVSMNLEIRLLQLGFDVVGAVSSREEALQLAERHCPDLVLMDVNLERSEYDGIDIARELNVRRPVPVVYLTAYADSPTLERAKATAPFGYVVKPFSVKDLQATIELSLHRFQLEQKLHRHDEWLQSTLESILDGVIVFGATGTIEFLNPAAEVLCGWKRDEAVGRDIDEVFQTVDAKGHSREFSFARQALVHRLAATDEPLGCLLVRKDGVQIPVVQSAAPFSRVQPRGEGVVLTFRDVTERRRLEDRLLRSNDELQQFASAASHDLQEPLRTITTYSQLLQRSLQDRLEAGEHQMVEFIAQGAQRMSSLVARLLEYGRLGSEAEVRESFAAQQSLEDALHNLRAKVLESQATITHNLSSTLHADRFQVVAVWQNLIANALKYSGPTKPVIHISDQQTASGPVFCVADNGIGIDPTYHQRIFSVFTRLDSGGAAGSGLGLAICKRIVERNGGRIWVESAAGQGARFFFTLGTAPGGDEPKDRAASLTGSPQ